MSENKEPFEFGNEPGVAGIDLAKPGEEKTVYHFSNEATKEELQRELFDLHKKYLKQNYELRSAKEDLQGSEVLLEKLGKQLEDQEVMLSERDLFIDKILNRLGGCTHGQ